MLSNSKRKKVHSLSRCLTVVTFAILSASGFASVQDQETIVGGTERTYGYDALAPGNYEFICTVHPIVAMTGTLTVR